MSGYAHNVAELLDKNRTKGHGPREPRRGCARAIAEVVEAVRLFCSPTHGGSGRGARRVGLARGQCVRHRSRLPRDRSTRQRSGTAPRGPVAQSDGRALTADPDPHYPTAPRQPWRGAIFSVDPTAGGASVWTASRVGLPRPRPRARRRAGSERGRDVRNAAMAPAVDAGRRSGAALTSAVLAECCSTAAAECPRPTGLPRIDRRTPSNRSS